MTSKACKQALQKVATSHWKRVKQSSGDKKLFFTIVPLSKKLPILAVILFHKESANGDAEDILAKTLDIGTGIVSEGFVVLPLDESPAAKTAITKKYTTLDKWVAKWTGDNKKGSRVYFVDISKLPNAKAPVPNPWSLVLSGDGQGKREARDTVPPPPPSVPQATKRAKKTGHQPSIDTMLTKKAPVAIQTTPAPVPPSVQEKEQTHPVVDAMDESPEEGADDNATKDPADVPEAAASSALTRALENLPQLVETMATVSASTPTSLSQPVLEKESVPEKDVSESVHEKSRPSKAGTQEVEAPSKPPKETPSKGTKRTRKPATAPSKRANKSGVVAVDLSGADALDQVIAFFKKICPPCTGTLDYLMEENNTVFIPMLAGDKSNLESMTLDCEEQTGPIGPPSHIMDTDPFNESEEPPPSSLPVPVPILPSNASSTPPLPDIAPSSQAAPSFEAILADMDKSFQAFKASMQRACMYLQPTTS